MMRSPCPPRRLRPLPHETQVLRTISRHEQVTDRQRVGGRRREPGPRPVLRSQALRDRVEPPDLDIMLEPVAEANEMECDRLALTPIIGAGMLDRVDVDRLPVQPPEGDVAELSGQDLSERRPTRRRGAEVRVRLVRHLRQVPRVAARARLGDGGQVIGRVDVVRFDPNTYQAIVGMNINQGVQLSKDTIASILTSGLLGEVYIGLDSGGDTVMLADGGRIAKTQSAVVLEKLIGQFLFDKASSGGGK